MAGMTANLSHSVAVDANKEFVGFEGSLQLYTELLNHRPASGTWQMATSACNGIARTFCRAQVGAE